MVVEEAGIDTWRPCWYVEPRLLDVWLQRSQEGESRRFVLPDVVMGHRVGVVPQHNLVWAEGHPGGDRLANPDDLPGVLERLTAALNAEDLPVPTSIAGYEPPRPARISPTRMLPPVHGERVARRAGFAGVSRLDGTMNLGFESGVDGLATLAAVAAVARDAPRCKGQTTWSVDGHQVETVYFRGHAGKKIVGRFYDKGAESGTAAPGRLVRPEDQRRYESASRRGVEELTSAYVGGKFRQRFAPLWQASKGVKVAGLPVLTESLLDKVEDGEITASQAETLAGHLLLVRAAKGRRRGGLGQSPATAARRRAALRDHGLVLADGVLQEVEVDLSETLERVLDPGVWGSGRPQG